MPHGPPPGSPIVTAMGSMTADTIIVRGHDLTGELLGNLDAGALFFLQVVGRRPDEAEARMINALIVSIAEHGMMPSVIAARLTLLGAPESLQGAVAAGLLGVGDVFVGPAGNVARLLQEEVPALGLPDDAAADAIAEAYLARRARIPGLGHPHHAVDPRTDRLLALQAELGLPDGHARMMRAIQAAAARRSGKRLTLNAVAAVGAIASDLGVDWRAVRGIGLVARTIGLIGHLVEEMRAPQGQAIWDAVTDRGEAPLPKSQP